VFGSAEKALINADWNGSANIIRKAFPNGSHPDGIKGGVVYPTRLKPCKTVA
jgi:transposase